MPFERPSLAALITETRQAIAAELPGTDATLRRSNFGVLGRVFAGLLHLAYGYLDWQARQLLPDTAETEFLERWANIYSIARLGAEAAAGNLAITGVAGTVLPAGAVFARPDGARYVTAAAATLGSLGTAEVAVVAEVGGAAGNVDPAAPLTLVEAVAGITGTAIVAAGGLTGGVDTEADDALRARLLERIRRPPQGGTAADYATWALLTPGVTRAFVTPLARGLGTVNVSFVMDGRVDIIPTALDVADVTAVIEARRPVTADVLVFAPVAAPLDVEISGLSPDTAAVRAAIVAEIAGQIRRDAIPGGTIRRSRLDEAISRATGEAFHTLVSPTGDVTHDPTDIAIAGTVTFS